MLEFQAHYGDPRDVGVVLPIVTVVVGGAVLVFLFGGVTRIEES